VEPRPSPRESVKFSTGTGAAMTNDKCIIDGDLARRLTKRKNYPKLAKTGFPPAFPLEQARRMAITVDIAEAEARVEELVARVEAGEDFLNFRDNAPVAWLTAFDAERRRAALEKTIADVRAFRARRKPVTAEELVAWKNEGRRY
jgi:antitoxin (DNA-binding transcriptional repressor) of toxin-antitoxin stability system